MHDAQRPQHHCVYDIRARLAMPNSSKAPGGFESFDPVHCLIATDWYMCNTGKNYDFFRTIFLFSFISISLASVEESYRVELLSRRTYFSTAVALISLFSSTNIFHSRAPIAQIRATAAATRRQPAEHEWYAALSWPVPFPTFPRSFRCQMGHSSGPRPRR
jgi:hypothetical protein